METDRPCRVLVTNDDGIESEGLQVLARHLAGAGHQVVVVAPDRDYSGSSSALGGFGPDVALAVRRVAIAGLDTDESWALEGPPALTVVAAMLGGFGDRPDVVASGINAGLNTGRSVLHSGTVGAALTAQNFGLSALAVSVASAEEWHWDTAASIAVETLPLVLAGPARSTVNLNVPGTARSEVRGTRWARLAPFGAVRASVTSRNDESLQFELVATDAEPDPDTDQGTVDAGWASLTTLIGVAEAWPAGPEDGAGDRAGGELAGAGGNAPAEASAGVVEVEPELVPGAELHAVHTVPDADRRLALRRPRFG